MKILLLFLFATTSVFAQKDFTPIGKWQSTDDDGNTIYMTFDADGFMTLQKGDEIIGGRHSETGDEAVQMTYKFIEGTNQVDFIVKALHGGQEIKLLGIYKVKASDEFILAMKNMERPQNFGEDALTFKRINQ